MEISQWAIAATIVGLGATLQTITTIGFALIAMAPLVILFGSSDAVPIVIALNLALSLVLLPTLGSLRSATYVVRLAISSLVGMPFGTIAFLYFDLVTLKVLAGGVIIAATVMMAWLGGPHLTHAKIENLAVDYAAGFAAGVLATALAMPGPPLLVVIWRRLANPVETRSIMAALMTVAYAGALISHVLVRSTSNEVWITASMLLPVVLAAAFIGTHAARIVGAHRFRPIVLAILLLSGISAIVSALVDITRNGG